jgi:hypothetical protein
MASNRTVLRLLFLLACALACATPLAAQSPEAEPVDALLRRLEGALNAGSREALATLFGPTVPPDDVRDFGDQLFVPGAIRSVVRERDRSQLEGAPPGDGYRLVVELFVETPGKARILTTNIDMRRPAGGALDSWRIVGAEELTAIEGLYRLRLDTSRAFRARNLEITSEDLVIALPDGTVFLVECDEGTTGLVLLGRGELRFAPAPASERGQLRIYADTDTLNAEFETAFIRLSPSDYRRRVTTASLTPAAPQERLVRRAQEVFRRESAKSFSVDLQDLSPDTWHLLPPQEDFLAEVDTRRFDTLTYSRSSAQAEDVSLFHREDRRTIALYPSVAKLAARGRFYSDDVLREYDVQDYSIDASLDPARLSIQARARVSIRVRATSVSNLMLRLAEPLTVSGVTSVEYGRLLHFRMRGQNAVLINLPSPVQQDSDVTLVMTYAGRLPSQDLDLDTVQLAPDAALQGTGPESTETSFLLSNRSLWYPQNPVPDYATASMRVTVPNGYAAVASGDPVADEGSLRDILTASNGNAFAFRASQPLRYLAVVVSRLRPVAERTVPVTDDPEAVSAGLDEITVRVQATPRQQARGRAIMEPTADILRFYTSLVGYAPYASATIAVIESDLPGGHSPGYFAVVNDPVASASTWRGDPAAFDGFPDFFLAHELAHQWWGQAVGWKNYHEQWLSEGFAQYFAALYARESRGERVFADMLVQFRRWSLSESDQGPVYLGYRLGHIQQDSRVFRALVYNKGAAVLHMLRLLLGDDPFFRGLRRFYADRRYQKAGTDDFERAMETESGRNLDRFFERWIYNSEMPRIRYDYTTAADGVTLQFEQLGDFVFDLPVTVTLSHADGRTTDVVVPVTDRVVEHTIAATTAVRRVQVNRDSAALAEFEER